MIAAGLHEPTPKFSPAEAARWPNFTPAELACKCNGRFCRGEYWHDPDFLDALQDLRNDQGQLRINSGHRCVNWNAVSHGAPKSPHLQIAVDIALAGHDRWALKEAALRLGFTGIGHGLNFLHLDRRPDKQRRWDYGAASRVAWKLDR